MPEWQISHSVFGILYFLFYFGNTFVLCFQFEILMCVFKLQFVLRWSACLAPHGRWLLFVFFPESVRSCSSCATLLLVCEHMNSLKMFEFEDELEKKSAKLGAAGIFMEQHLPTSASSVELLQLFMFIYTSGR